MKQTLFLLFLFVPVGAAFLTACGSQPARSTPTPTNAPPIPPTASLTPLPPSPTSPTVPTVTPTRNTIIVTPLPLKTRLDQQGVEQVWVPAGAFLIGTSEEDAQALLAQKYVSSWMSYALDRERPQHEVRLSNGYWIDRYEVTNAAFQAFVDAGGYQKQEYWSEAGWAWLEKQPSGVRPKKASGKLEIPRSNVTWYEAEAYARWRGGRLPTEAEWEYAARGPQSLVYPWGNEYDDTLCNINHSSLQPGGSYPGGASWVSAMDMAGNVMEWVQDWYDTEYYKLQERDDPQGPATGTVKIEKGGWMGGSRLAARAAYAHYEDPPYYSDLHIGFRIVTP